ncbi:TPA: hypothetical protein DCW38_03395 [candidate division WOR-3 bacterium]|jgi:hypothetical protein|uniref:Uncharacterized protein n=1 Tax=candidate division WOR-3 bacterium TaxID=2052148 RepID=A0A350H9J1_UNCW3|nr:hypothetical protein [candidate division WOR-3 bacterium]
MNENKQVEILESVIKQMLNPIRNIPLYLIIESICGNKILEYDLSENEVLKKAKKLSSININKEGIKSVRPNEVGNYAEPFIIEAFESLGFSASIPITNEGGKRSAGYPDICQFKWQRFLY